MMAAWNTSGPQAAFVPFPPPPIFETFLNFSITLYLYPYQRAPYEAHNKYVLYPLFS